MKKYIYSIFLLAISSLILSSCGTLSFTKRVHNKGYHISYTKHYSDSKNENIEESTEQSIRAVKIDEVETKMGTTIAKQESEDLQIQKTNNTEMKMEYASNENKLHQITSTTKTNSVSESTPSFNPIKVIFNDNEPRQIIKKMAPASDEGLSLLWIVIIILLLLWLLGYIGGIGNFIHLLLVIALILLILWLLHII